jgi:hypothetical protein
VSILCYWSNETKFCSMFFYKHVTNVFCLQNIISNVTVSVPRNDSKQNCVFLFCETELRGFFSRGLVRNKIPIDFRFAKHAEYQRSAVCFVLSCSVFRGKFFWLKMAIMLVGKMKGQDSDFREMLKKTTQEA